MNQIFKTIYVPFMNRIGETKFDSNIWRCLVLSNSFINKKKKRRLTTISIRKAIYHKYETKAAT